MLVAFLYGPPAVGKLTVATELGALTGLPVFHNHLAVDAARCLFPFGSAAVKAHPRGRLADRLWRGRSGRAVVHLHLLPRAYGAGNAAACAARHGCRPWRQGSLLRNALQPGNARLEGCQRRSEAPCQADRSGRTAVPVCIGWLRRRAPERRRAGGYRTPLPQGCSPSDCQVAGPRWVTLGASPTQNAKGWPACQMGACCPTGMSQASRPPAASPSPGSLGARYCWQASSPAQSVGLGPRFANRQAHTGPAVSPLLPTLGRSRHRWHHVVRDPAADARVGGCRTNLGQHQVRAHEPASRPSPCCPLCHPMTG